MSTEIKSSKWIKLLCSSCRKELKVVNVKNNPVSEIFAEPCECNLEGTCHTCKWADDEEYGMEYHCQHCTQSDLGNFMGAWYDHWEAKA